MRLESVIFIYPYLMFGEFKNKLSFSISLKFLYENV